MKFKFQSFFDVSTSASSLQVLQFSVGGKTVLDRCRHLFGAYKYFKLGKISVKMCPASTLPVDPLQLSYSSSDPQTVDPRDQMNPGLVRITNGEDIFTDISSLDSGQQERIYTTMMLDPRWSKFMLQSGFRRSAYPLYWQVGQLSQDKYPGATVNVPDGWALSNSGVTTYRVRNVAGTGIVEDVGNVSSARGLFQVGHRGRLGFLPTDFYQDVRTMSGSTLSHEVGINNIPEVKVITCVLPKAFKTLYFYRIYVTEEVIFSGLRAGPPVFTWTPSSGVQVTASVGGLDQFVYGQPVTVSPTGNLIVPSMMPNNGQELP